MPLPHPKCHLWFALAALMSACVHRPPLTRLDQPTPITVVVLVDEKDKTSFDAAPADLNQAIDRELDKRNLVREQVQPGTLEPLTETRNSKNRAELLAKSLGPHRLFLLIELKVLFFDQFEGGYKWTIDGQLTVARTDDLLESTVSPFGTSVFLDQDSQKEHEALQQGAGALADKVAILLDGHFGGHTGTEQLQPPPRAELPWSARPLYFVLLDRFAPGSSPHARVDLTDPDFWHGGSLATLGQHLDELQALGVGALWLSPVSLCREKKLGLFGPAHCYWTEDLDAIEPRLGTWAELRALRDSLHARGLRLVMDVVLNHVAPDSPLLRDHPDWFHPPRAIVDFNDREQLETGRLGGLPDLAQEKPEVADYLIAATQRLIDRVQPDGLRLDAVKHVPVAFWSRFTREIHAAHPDLLLIGEDLDFSPVHLAEVQLQTGFDALFDFPLQGSILGAVCKGDGTVGAIAARISLDRLAPPESPGALPRWATLLDNHDLPRLFTSCGNDASKAETALAVLFGLRGIPTLTYGTEAELSGVGDPENRADLTFPVTSPFRGVVAHLAELRAAHPALAQGLTLVATASRDAVGLVRWAPGEVAWIFLGQGVVAPPPAALGGPWTSVLNVSDGPIRFEIRVAEVTAQGASWLAALSRGQQGNRQVRFEVSTPPSLHPGDVLAVTGGAPELGEWDPHRAIPVQGPGWLALPANGAYEMKLLVRRADGAVDWQPGANTVVYVAAGDVPATLNLDWARRG